MLSTTTTTTTTVNRAFNSFFTSGHLKADSNAISSILGIKKSAVFEALFSLMKSKQTVVRGPTGGTRLPVASFY